MKMKNCPFCNGIAELEDAYDEQFDMQLWRVSCTSCQVETYPQIIKEEAIKAWNRRSNDCLWEVFVPAVNVGDKIIPVAWFLDENEAEELCRNSRERGHGYMSFKKRKLMLTKYAIDFWKMRDIKERSDALAKLTPRERKILGIE